MYKRIPFFVIIVVMMCLVVIITTTTSVTWKVDKYGAETAKSSPPTTINIAETCRRVNPRQLLEQSLAT